MTLSKYDFRQWKVIAIFLNWNKYLPPTKLIDLKYEQFFGTFLKIFFYDEIVLKSYKLYIVKYNMMKLPKILRSWS